MVRGNLQLKYRPWRRCISVLVGYYICTLHFELVVGICYVPVVGVLVIIFFGVVDCKFCKQLFVSEIWGMMVRLRQIDD
jgi:hypothetical protein